MNYRKSFFVYGGFFGDEGKGTTTDFLASHNDIKIVMKCCGGAQAAHFVHRDDGKKFRFSQFGSSSSPVITIIDQDFIIEPISMMEEARALSDFWDIPEKQITSNIYISRHANIATPINRARNVILEMKLRHGSCGFGIGETRRISREHPERKLTALGTLITNTKKLLLRQKEAVLNEFPLHSVNKEIIERNPVIYGNDEIIDKIAEFYTWWSKQINIVSDETIKNTISDEPVVFESTQGTLLDENYGFHPYTTWSSVTPDSVDRIVRRYKYKIDIENLMVIRTYMTRHGCAYLKTGIKDQETWTKLSEGEDNTFNTFQGELRLGSFDFGLLKYSSDMTNPDAIMLTHGDKFVKGWETISPEYEFLTPRCVEDSVINSKEYQRLMDYNRKEFDTLEDFIDEIQKVSYTSIKYLSSGKTKNDKEIRS